MSDLGAKDASLAAQIDELCDRFEAAWGRAESPVIEDYLPKDERQRNLALLELVRADLECRLSNGELVQVEAYLDRYAELANNQEAALALIAAEYRFRQRGTDRVSAAEYEERFPQFAPHLASSLLNGLSETQQADQITFTCPFCYHPSQIASGTLREEAVCPHCETTIQIAAEVADNWDPRSLPILGKFQLIAEVGRGAFGTVYRAWDTALERTVAVKVPRSGTLLDRQDEDRFVREARSVAQLRHPSIVPVYETNRSEAFPYIVSEFVEGVTLADHLSAGNQFTFRESAELVAEVAECLNHAHRLGVVHRDLKPSNMMLEQLQLHGGSTHESSISSSGSSSRHHLPPVQLPFRVRVMDFGLARREEGEVTMTMDGQVLGTPAYMSPEQASGQGHRVDGRSDIYSLGVILFQLVTGELPFRGNVRMLLQQVVHDEPPVLRKLNNSVPKDLETICLKCLEKDRSKRYATSLDLADELYRFLTGRPITARPVSRLEHAWRWCRRNPSYTALYAAIVLVTLAGFLGVAWQLRQTLRSEAARLVAEVNSLATAEPEAIPEKVNILNLEHPIVVAALRDLSMDHREQVRLRARLALLPIDPSFTADAYRGLLRADAREFASLRQVIETYQAQAQSPKQCAAILTETAREALNDGDAPADLRLHAAALLREGKDFDRYVEFIVGCLLSQAINEPQAYPYLLEMFRGSSIQLSVALQRVFDDTSASERERAMSAAFLAEYLKSDFKALASLVMRSSPAQFTPLMNVVSTHPTFEAKKLFTRFINKTVYLGPNPETSSDGTTIPTSKRPLNDAQAVQVANSAIALVQLGDPQLAWKLLRPRSDPSVQCHLIDRFSRLGVQPHTLVEQFRIETDADVRAALMLALCGYPSPSLRNAAPKIATEIRHVYLADPHPSLHSAARLMLYSLGMKQEVQHLDDMLRTEKHAMRGWQVNSAGLTMVGLALPMKSHQPMNPISHNYAISTMEVTVEQLSAHAKPWLKGKWVYQPIAKDCPAFMVPWSEAASYCNWLSMQEGIPREQWCYERTGEDNGLPLFEAKSDAISLVGYRLPTREEWEFACRSGTETARFFGEDPGLLSEYAWWGGNTGDGDVRPVATRKPNQYGMFDMYGNVLEWCHDYPHDGPAVRLLRGLGAGDLEFDRTTPIRSEDATPHGNEQIAGGTGFRVAKTLK